MSTPKAAALVLFEATAEASFLVANADGEFDDKERAAFLSVVSKATNFPVEEDQIASLVDNLARKLAEDGIEKRAQMVARLIVRRDQQEEILRVAAMMARVTGGVSKQELDVLDNLARGFELNGDAVEKALAQAEEEMRDH